MEHEDARQVFLEGPTRKDYYRASQYVCLGLPAFIFRNQVLITSSHFFHLGLLSIHLPDPDFTESPDQSEK